jgi:hypothetical protein
MVFCAQGTALSDEGSKPTIVTITRGERSGASSRSHPEDFTVPSHAVHCEGSRRANRAEYAIDSRRLNIPSTTAVCQVGNTIPTFMTSQLSSTCSRLDHSSSSYSSRGSTPTNDGSLLLFGTTPLTMYGGSNRIPVEDETEVVIVNTPLCGSALTDNVSPHGATRRSVHGRGSSLSPSFPRSQPLGATFAHHRRYASNCSPLASTLENGSGQSNVSSPDRPSSMATGSVLDGMLDDEDEDDDEEGIDDVRNDGHSLRSPPRPVRQFTNCTATSLIPQPSLYTHSPVHLQEQLEPNCSLLDVSFDSGHTSTTTADKAIDGDEGSLSAASQPMFLLSPSSSFVAIESTFQDLGNQCVEDDEEDVELNEELWHRHANLPNPDDRADSRNSRIVRPSSSSSPDARPKTPENLAGIVYLGSSNEGYEDPEHQSLMRPCCMVLSGSSQALACDKHTSATSSIKAVSGETIVEDTPSDLAQATPRGSNSRAAPTYWTQRESCETLTPVVRNQHSLHSSLLDRMADRLVESFCHRSSSVLATPPPARVRKNSSLAALEHTPLLQNDSSPACGPFRCHQLTCPESEHKSADFSPIAACRVPGSNSLEAYLQVVQVDMLNLLGCMDGSAEYNLDHETWIESQAALWKTASSECAKGNKNEINPPSPKDCRPRRHSLRERAFRLHRLKLERGIRLRESNDIYFSRIAGITTGSALGSARTRLKPRSHLVGSQTQLQPRIGDSRSSERPFSSEFLRKSMDMAPRPWRDTIPNDEEAGKRVSEYPLIFDSLLGTNQSTRHRLESKAEGDDGQPQFKGRDVVHRPHRRSRSLEDHLSRLNKDIAFLRRGDPRINQREAVPVNSRLEHFGLDNSLPNLNDWLHSILNGWSDADTDTKAGTKPSEEGKCSVARPKISSDPDDDLLGYDSDPGDTSMWKRDDSGTNQRSVDLALAERRALFIPGREFESVQATMNMSWNLTWHPGRSTKFRRPLSIAAWIERGTLLENGLVMLEPKLMWREQYQDKLTQRRELNLSSRQPHNIKILSVSRILEARENISKARKITAPSIDRSLYPLARISCSFFVRTGPTSDDDFLFEAPTREQRDNIVTRWKLCIARFAALAVVEDMVRLTDEFFHPVLPVLDAPSGILSELAETPTRDTLNL